MIHCSFSSLSSAYLRVHRLANKGKLVRFSFFFWLLVLLVRSLAQDKSTAMFRLAVQYHHTMKCKMSRLDIGIEDDDFVFVGRISEQDPPSIVECLHLATNYRYCCFMCVINCPMLKEVTLSSSTISHKFGREMATQQNRADDVSRRYLNKQWRTWDQDQQDHQLTQILIQVLICGA